MNTGLGDVDETPDGLYRRRKVEELESDVKPVYQGNTEYLVYGEQGGNDGDEYQPEGVGGASPSVCDAVGEGDGGSHALTVTAREK